MLVAGLTNTDDQGGTLHAESATSAGCQPISRWRINMSKKFALAFLALWVLGVVTLSAAAAEGGHRSRGHHGMMMGDFGDPDRMLGHLERRLDLDDDQALRIGNILDAISPESDALQERALMAREAMATMDTANPDYDVQLQDLAREIGEIATSMTLLHGRMRAEITAQLSAEQADKFAESRSRMRDRAGRHHGPIEREKSDTE